MPNDYFEFKKFTVRQSGCAQKVSTDACIFGAWVASLDHSCKTVIDIGAGTGVLMLMIAQKNEAEIHGVEIEQSCALQLAENIAASPWPERQRSFHADARTHAYACEYDMVISNPPFYENQLRSPSTSKNLAWHSHELSFSELTETASGILSAQGIFAVILPFTRKDEAIDTAASYGLYPSRSMDVRHSADHPFSRSLICFSKQRASCVAETMAIRNADSSYSQQFIELLSDFYLFL